jgi:hypothetical protein
MSLPTHDEKRQTQRHRLGRLASMIPTDGGPPRFCLVTDFSEGGVRVNANGLKKFRTNSFCNFPAKVASRTGPTKWSGATIRSSAPSSSGVSR